MSEDTNNTTDELTPALRKALVELGAVILTTAIEVALAERHLEGASSPSQTKASFIRLKGTPGNSKRPSNLIKKWRGAER